MLLKLNQLILRLFSCSRASRPQEVWLAVYEDAVKILTTALAPLHRISFRRLKHFGPVNGE